MTEQETKNKIIEILRYEKDEFIKEERHGYIEKVDFDKLASALISAGIGDTTELLQKVQELERELRAVKGALKECVIENMPCGECDIRLLGKCKMTDEQMKNCADIYIDDYIKQAEKELNEEKENEQ